MKTTNHCRDLLPQTHDRASKESKPTIPTFPTNQHISSSSDPRQRPLPQATNHPHANAIPFAVDLIQPIKTDSASPVVFSSIRIKVKGKGNWVADYFKKQQRILEGCLGMRSFKHTANMWLLF
ncbi:hypothetical protein CFP56_031462 [Quercus suber]|uniref:Uncharacterized protein n=1 Tax=Quercus suber TaxID=58331 RepID=A0AAW0LTH6_QUESU